MKQKRDFVLVFQKYLCEMTQLEKYKTESAAAQTFAEVLNCSYGNMTIFCSNRTGPDQNEKHDFNRNHFSVTLQDTNLSTVFYWTNVPGFDFFFHAAWSFVEC